MFFLKFSPVFQQGFDIQNDVIVHKTSYSPLEKFSTYPKRSQAQDLLQTVQHDTTVDHTISNCRMLILSETKTCFLCCAYHGRGYCKVGVLEGEAFTLWVGE